MNERLRIVLAVILIIAAMFYKPGVSPTPAPDRIPKPSSDIIKLIEPLPAINDNADSAKLSGFFMALSDKLVGLAKIKKNIQVAYLLDFTGKKTFNQELMVDGKKKYPTFSPAAADIMQKAIGSQSDDTDLTQEEKLLLSKIFHGFAWKLYKKDSYSVFDAYKNKTLKAILEYNNEDVPDDTPDEKCGCEGKGYIIHGDGHKTDCPCVAAGKKCMCTGSKVEKKTVFTAPVITTRPLLLPPPPALPVGTIIYGSPIESYPSFRPVRRVIGGFQ